MYTYAYYYVRRYEDKIETVRQFYATGFHWGVPNYAWVFTLENAQVPHIKGIFHRFEIYPEEVMHNRTMAGSFGVAIERLHAGSYSFMSYVRMDTLEHQDVR